ncbi:MAG: acylphosphatase [Deltaproteobacteria bacterium]|nr:acylphosphatase [Deltaproteobacteria bacterium]
MSAWALAPDRRARVLVSGRVQGVWFRGATADQAERLGVAGWVRNLSDGRVEATFEGRAADVETAIEWCRSGPPTARVDAVSVEWQSPIGEVGFRVRY